MKITNPEALMAASISRRSLVKTSAIGSLALASSAFTLPFSRIAHAAADLASGNVAEKAVWSSCTVNCGSRCLLRLPARSFYSSPDESSRSPEISDETRW